MTGIDFYNRIEDPLSDDAVVTKIMKTFAESAKPSNRKSFYTLLTEQNGLNKGQYYDLSEMDKFYVTVYNIWKESFLKEYANVSKDTTPNAHYQQLERALRTSPTFHSREEIENYFHEQGLAEIIGGRDFMYARKSSYFHFNTRSIKPDKGDFFNVDNIKHRFYLNLNNKDLHKFARKFVEKCEDKGLSYYFKIYENLAGKKDESIVVYSSTENLLAYYEVLKEIGKEMPEVTKREEKPVLLAGTIDGWIGYGANPNKMEKTMSYNGLRALILQKCLDATYSNFIGSNLKAHIRTKTRTYTLEEYITTYLTNLRLEGYENVSPTVVEQLKENYRRQLSEYIKKGDHAESITIDTNIARTVTDPSEVAKVFRILGGKELLPLKSIREEFKRQVKTLSPYYQVLPDNMCFNIDTRGWLEEYDQKAPSVEAEYQELLAQAKEKNTAPPRTITLTESLAAYANYLRIYRHKNNRITTDSEKTVLLDDDLTRTEEIPVEEIRRELERLNQEKQAEEKASTEVVDQVKPTDSNHISTQSNKSPEEVPIIPLIFTQPEPSRKEPRFTIANDEMAYRLNRNQIIQDQLSKSVSVPPKSEENEMYRMLKSQIIQDDLARPNKK